MIERKTHGYVFISLSVNKGIPMDRILKSGQT